MLGTGEGVERAVDECPLACCKNLSPIFRLVAFDLELLDQKADDSFQGNAVCWEVDVRTVTMNSSGLSKFGIDLQMRRRIVVHRTAGVIVTKDPSERFLWFPLVLKT